MPRGVLKNENLCGLGFILSVLSYLSSSPACAVCVSLLLRVSASLCPCISYLFQSMSGSTLVSIQNYNSSLGISVCFHRVLHDLNTTALCCPIPVFLSQDVTVVLEDPELYVDQAGLLPAAGIKHMCHHI